MRTQLPIVVLLLALLVAGCGSSGKSDGSVSIQTIKQHSRTITYAVPSSAMEPTLLCARPAPGCTAAANDRVVIQEPASRIRRQDIIVFRAPRAAALKCGEGGTFVKRVIGLPGETVREDGHGFIEIDGARLSEPYVSKANRLADTAHFGQTWHVGPSDYFTMGDDRANSCDSRSWGDVPQANVAGKIVKILRPG